VNALLFLVGGGVTAYLVVRHQLSKLSVETVVHEVERTIQPFWRWGKPATTADASSNSPLPSAPAPSPAPPSPPPAFTRPAMNPPTSLPTEKELPLAGRWVWPVPRWQGRAPVISDGFGSSRGKGTHAGVDIMFARLPGDSLAAGSPNGSKGYVMPDGWVAVAASDGRLWSAQKTPRGFAVVLDHGEVATFYTHLDALLVPETKAHAGTPAEQRIAVKAGQPLGLIGFDPLDHERLKHLHFELWHGGPGDAVDPKALMKAWRTLMPNDVAPFFSTLPRNARPRDGQRPDLVHVGEHYRAYPGERQQ